MNTYNCQYCGACCKHRDDPKWIEVTAEDAKKIPLAWLQVGDIEPFAMRQTDSGRCVAFEWEVGKHCRCSIYDIRPSICRKVQPHDEICEKLRIMNNVNT
jgi:uncharacterized protein